MKKKQKTEDTTAYDRKLYQTSASTRAEVSGWNERQVTPKERYSVENRLNDGLRRILDHELDETRLWTSVKLRKQADCCVCGRAILQGEQAWSPMTNSSNRWHRAHGECFA